MINIISGISDSQQHEDGNDNKSLRDKMLKGPHDDFQISQGFQVEL